MLLASNKQQHKKITKNRKTQQDRKNTQKKDSRQEQRPRGLTRAPHLQDFIQNHSEYSNRRNSKKEFFLVEQPSSPL
jgi:hypothetical protein